MSSIPTLPGIVSRMIATPRLTLHALLSGPEDGVPVVFIHGMVSSSTWWEETMLALPAPFRAIAVDLRGFGDTEDQPIDATRGYGDWVDDMRAFASAAGLERYHVVGISMGGGLLFSLLPAAGASIRSATMINPTSPYGWSGSRDLAGTPCYGDYAGTGAGGWLPEVVQRMATKDRSSANLQTSPRAILSQCWKASFRPAREEDLLSSILSTKIGPDKFPGDVVASPHWPGFAPGVWGASNATSPKYVGDTVERFVAVSPKPPILWVRGADDQVVADNSLADIGTLGKLGIVPGWPGEDVYPPQPMVSQTRAVLERYRANGGTYREHVMADTGHAPMIEQTEAFIALLIEHLSAA